MRAFEQAEDSPGQMTFEAALDFSWTAVPRLMLAVLRTAQGQPPRRWHCRRCDR